MRRLGWLLLGMVIGQLLQLAIPKADAGTLLGETPTYAREQGMDQEFAYVAAGNGVGQLEYQGFAQPNSLTSAAKWQIRKFTYDSSNRLSDIKWANGTDNTTLIWNSRASYDYDPDS